MSADHDLHRIVPLNAEERDYLLRRAEDHRLLAENCDVPGVRSIHRRLQQLYRKQATSLG